MKISRKRSYYWLFLSFFILILGCTSRRLDLEVYWGKAQRELILATTTSVYDSGLLEEIVAKFEKEFGFQVKVLAVGSGEAIEMGRRGDADALLVHSPEEEERFMRDGFGKDRQLIMANHFILLGPVSDPSRVKGLSVIEAFKRIAQSKQLYVSRADNSGTHQKEREVWRKAGIKPKGSWYLETGQGMGESLKIASEKQAYILSDKGTYLSLKNNLELQVLSEEDQNLLNLYCLITVSPRRFPGVNYQSANDFKNFLLTPEVQKFIDNFGKDDLGEPIFIPLTRLKNTSSLLGGLIVSFTYRF